jgi:hypothetical protein
VHELVRDVLEQRDEVDLLLVLGTERAARLLADDGHDRLLVELGVVEAVEQVDSPGPGRGHADARLAGELRVRGRREARDLLVADLYELDPVAGVVEGAEEPVDTVARVAVDAPDAPLGEALEEECGDVLWHGVLSRRCGRRAATERRAHSCSPTPARSRPPGLRRPADSARRSEHDQRGAAALPSNRCPASDPPHAPPAPSRW